MKVLFCTYDEPGYIAGGINSWMQRLIPDLNNKYNIEIVTLFIYYGDIKKCPTINYFNNNKLDTRVINRERYMFTEDLVKRILKITFKENITSVVANHVIPALYAHKYLQEFNIPVIPVFHSNEPHTKGVIEKFINNSVNGFKMSVSVSKQINSYINPQKGSTHLIIPCGTPLTDYRAKIDSYKLKIIYAGRIEIEQKQILLLTNAFISASKLIPELEFNIYGNGSQEHNTKRLIESNKINNVNFRGAVAPSEIQKIMSEHHIFTLLSDYEGMPVALMEAMSCGLVPVCLNEESGINEIIKDGVNGFIVKDRDQDYQEKLRLLQKDPELWKRMSANAIKTIEEKYSAEITHNEWAHIFQSSNIKPIKPIKIPFKIKLEPELLIYNEIRKPIFIKSLFIKIKYHWHIVHIFVRPRVRLRALKEMIFASKGKI